MKSRAFFPSSWDISFCSHSISIWLMWVSRKVLVGMLHVVLKNGHINIFAHRITGLCGKSVPGISGLCDVCARTPVCIKGRPLPFYLQPGVW